MKETSTRHCPSGLLETGGRRTAREWPAQTPVSNGPRAARANAREKSTTALPVSCGPREARETPVSCVGFTEKPRWMILKIESA
jgi:hypothetical protein